MKRCSGCREAKSTGDFASNQGKCKACNKLYRETHKVEISAYKALWYSNNKVSIAATVSHWKSENSDKLREYKRSRRANLHGLTEHFTELEWNDLLVMYGARCMNPECLATENLTRDHIVPLISGGCDTIENIQILCGSCNSRKGTTSVDYKILHCYNSSVSILI